MSVLPKLTVLVGRPSVADTIADIDACYAYLLSQGSSPSDIVLYGLSVGSGPTVNLASRTPGLGGVILHAPMASGGGPARLQAMSCYCWYTYDGQSSCTGMETCVISTPGKQPWQFGAGLSSFSGYPYPATLERELPDKNI